MTDPRPRVDVFVEDEGQRAFIAALLRRLAQEENVIIDMDEISARGGHGRVFQELEIYQRKIEIKGGQPDVLVVVIDANCQGWQKMVNQVKARLRVELFPCIAIAVPDPHVERWYMADPQALKQCLGVHANPGTRKCEKGFYKKKLRDALRSADYPVTLGGAEYAEDVVRCMDDYQAAKHEPSLKAFIQDLRNCLRSLKP